VVVNARVLDDVWDVHSWVMNNRPVLLLKFLQSIIGNPDLRVKQLPQEVNLIFACSNILQQLRLLSINVRVLIIINISKNFFFLEIL
jgi:hypothetical protein